MTPRGSSGASSRKRSHDAADIPSLPSVMASPSPKRTRVLNSDAASPTTRHHATSAAAGRQPGLINLKKRSAVPLVSTLQYTSPVSVAASGHTEAEDKKKSGYQAFLQRKPPSALGSKPVPGGAQNCLSGLAFVQTGELSCIARSDVADLIQRYGGRSTSAVSGKTDYLIVGDDAGATKIAKAKSLGTKTLDEDGFFDLIRTRPEVSDNQVQASKTKTQLATEARVSAISPTAAAQTAALWVDKYRPSKPTEIIGNKTAVERLTAWLAGFAKARAGNFRYTGDQNSTHLRAALLSGPPGIGKTTAAHVVARSLGLHVLEFNASDVRSKKALDEIAATIFHNKSLYQFKSMNPSANPETQVIIMDEVDGMSTDDRGGLAELTTLLKKTKVPVICICNDRSNPKLRTLAGYCLDLRFRRPEANQIRSRIMTICYREGLKIQGPAVDALITATHGDIRQLINLLSTYRLGSGSMEYDEAKMLGDRTRKDLSVGVFDVIRSLLGAEFRRQSLREKLEHYFNDYDLVPLFVQENYLSCRTNDSFQSLQEMSKAADAMAIGNHVEKAVRMHQRWSLLNTHNVFSTVAPAAALTGFAGAMFQFPRLLGKISSTGKKQRMLMSLGRQMSKRMAGTAKPTLRLDMLPVLAILVGQGMMASDGFSRVIALMDHYYLSREDVDGVFELGLGACSKDAYMKAIPSATKARFTREYNKTEHPVAMVEVGAKKGRRVADIEESFGEEADGSNGHPNHEEGVGEGDEVEAEDDDDAEQKESKSSRDAKGLEEFRVKTVTTTTARGVGGRARGGARGKGEVGCGSRGSSHKAATPKKK